MGISRRDQRPPWRERITGADVCQEYKVVAPLTKSRRMGRGSVLHGGTVADVGHLYAFGNTEERYRIKILGCKGKGTLGVDRPFNHTTVTGHICLVRDLVPFMGS